jgi:uncharacterized protein YjgD (DUF1641 family)
MSDHETLALLKSIDSRLSAIENQVAPKSLEGLKMPNEVSIFTDSLDRMLDPASESGQENLEKIESLKNLVNELTKKETLDAFVVLTQSLKDLSYLSSHLKEIENTLSVITDSVDEMMSYAISSGLNIEDLGENLKTLSSQVLNLMETGALAELMSSGILDNKSIEVVGTLGQSLAVSRSHERRVGPIQAVGALFNADIQRSLGFAINLATHFGRKLHAKKGESNVG